MKTNKTTIIKDDKSREVIRINDKGQICIARFPDMSDSFKEYLMDLYMEVTDEDPQKLRDFLDYKTEENEFCS